MEIKTGHIKCSSCGAPMNLPEGAINKIKCSFCGVENYIYNEDITTGGMNFTLNDAAIHKHLINVFSPEEYSPYDIFTESNVKKVNKLIVPGYLFIICTGIGTLQYEKGISREVTSYSDDGDDNSYSVTDWHPMSMAVSDTRDYLVSGNKEYDSAFKQLFGENRTLDILPADKLDFPEDSQEVKFDLSEGEVLGRSLKELVEKTIVEKGLDSVEKGSTRKERVDGITTQKGEVRKVSVALYEIILEYKHKDYKIWLSNDGSKFAFDELPVDPNAKAHIEELKAAFDVTRSNDSVKLMSVIVGLIIVGILTLFIGLGLILLLVAGILIVVYVNGEKDFKKKEDAYKNAKNEFAEGFNKSKTAFINNKVALKGVLNHLSGNDEAF